MQKVVRVPVSVKGTANLLPGQEYLIGERAIAYPIKGRKTVRYVAAVSPLSGVTAGRGGLKSLAGVFAQWESGFIHFHPAFGIQVIWYG